MRLTLFPWNDEASSVYIHFVAKTGETNLCVAGGIFLNCLANAKLARAPGVRDFFAQPAANDAGTAIGAAALSWIAAGGDPQLRYDSMLLGTSWSDAEIERVLEESGFASRRLDRSDLVKDTVALLADERVVAFFQGRMEFGPRALGARSFLASPRSAHMVERLNAIKGREQFRPLAPCSSGCASLFDVRLR